MTRFQVDRLTGRYISGESNANSRESNAKGIARSVAPPQEIDQHAPGARKLYNLARPYEQGGGPAFAVLPLREDPATTHTAACFLVNTENLALPNAWTASEWSDGPGGQEFQNLAGADNSDFEALIAGPQGRVYHIKRTGLEKPSITELHHSQLRHEMAVWAQLREGTIIGSVRLQGGDGDSTSPLIPLVNITAIQIRDTSNQQTAKEVEK